MNSIISNYSFNASTKTITLNDVGTVDVKRVRFIKNLTTNTMIYALTESLTISATTNKIVFTGPNAGMANTDDISIQYDLDASLDTQKTSNDNIGLITDAVASSDTGSFSIIAFFKRALQNWTTLQTKFPSLGFSNAATSIPVALSVETSTGTITTQNLNPNGVATAASAVEISLQNTSQLAIQTVGTYTGNLSVQITIDGVNWQTITVASILRPIAGTYITAIPSTEQSLYKFECAGVLKARITALAAVTGSVTVSLRAVANTGTVAVTNPLPTGTNSIGNIGTVATVTTVTGVTTVASVTSANLAIPGLINDVATAAITTTTTTAALTPTFGTTYQVVIPVTVVSGTTPTLDIDVQESDDTGTNWFTVYSFPRITATGIYRSPKLPLRGNRVRYVQTISGTTPSFTRQINRLQSSDSVNLSISQLIDRSIVLTTLNSATPSLNVQNCKNVAISVNVGAITTTAPQLQLECSDDNGATWTAVGAPLTAVASSTVILRQTDTNAALIRARVSTAGVGVTAGFVLLKGY